MQGKKPLNIAIGRRIQQSREQAGLTQEELAERIDRSTQFISTIERGLAGPSLETVIHLCEVLGTSTEWILRGRALLPDSNLLAASVMEKLSGLSPAQLLLVDRMTSDLIKLLQMRAVTNELLSLQYGGIDRRIAFPAAPLHEVHRPAAKSMAVGLSR